MTTKELNEKIRNMDAFNIRYKTKPIYHISTEFENENQTTMLIANVFGFINHEKKYELSEYCIIENDNVLQLAYNFEKVENFSNYTDKNYNYVKLLNDYLDSPEDRIKEFSLVLGFDEIVCADNVLDNDIVLKDMVILSNERKINDEMCSGFYSLFYGQCCEKNEYKKYINNASQDRNLFSEIISLIKNNELSVENLSEFINTYDINNER